MSSVKTIIYLHGFLSSPASLKGRVFGEKARARGLTYKAPDLNVTDPRCLPFLLDDLLRGESAERVAVIGSSLGGFYAAWLAGRRPVRTLLINPAVRPWLFVEKYLGEQKTADGRTLLIRPDFAQSLDWHEALRAYPASPQYVIEGSDHAVSDIDRYADALTDFLVNGTLPLKRAAISAGEAQKRILSDNLRNERH